MAATKNTPNASTTSTIEEAKLEARTKIEVRNSTIYMGFFVRMNKDDKNPTYHNIEIDYSKTSKDELAKIAACALRVKYQAKLRELDPAFVKELSKNVRRLTIDDILEGLEDNRPSVVATAKAMFATKEPSPEQILMVEEIFKAQGITNYKI